MEVVIGGLWVTGCHGSHVELQTVYHHTGVGIGLAGLGHGAVGDDDGPALVDGESDERRAGGQGALCRRGKPNPRSHHLSVDAHLDVGLRLVGVRVVMIGLQCVLAGRHAGDGQRQRCRRVGNLRQVAVDDVGGQHLVGNDAQSLGLHVGLAPVAAQGRGSPAGGEDDGHAALQRLGVALHTGNGPGDVVEFGVFAGGSLAGQVEVDVLCRHSRSAAHQHGN